jgi:hypothetical protein
VHKPKEGAGRRRCDQMTGCRFLKAFPSSEMTIDIVCDEYSTLASVFYECTLQLNPRIRRIQHTNPVTKQSVETPRPRVRVLELLQERPEARVRLVVARAQHIHVVHRRGSWRHWQRWRW